MSEPPERRPRNDAALEPVPAPRQRVREITTALAAFGVAFLLGDEVLRLITAPPFVLIALMFVGLYVGSYILFWRLSAKLWK